MTLSFPLSFPTTITESDISWTIITAASKKTSPYTYKSQVQEWDGSAWGISVAIDPLDREEAAPWMAFLAALRGPVKTFSATPYLLREPLGNPSGSPKVYGADQYGYVLDTYEWTPNTAILKAGDLFQIGTRAFMTTKDVTSNGSGEATLDFAPGIFGPAHDEEIITINPSAQFRLVGNQIPIIRAGSNKKFTIQFSAEEAL